jgi:uncharacterized protein (TIGR03066 family)
MSATHLALAGCLLLAPAPEPKSNNEGKIVGKWESDGGGSVPLPPGAKMVLEFAKDGKMAMHISAGAVNKTITGKYKLKKDDGVELYDLSEAVSGREQHQETVTIVKDRLTMKDSDGKSLTFRRVKEKAK